MIQIAAMRSWLPVAIVCCIIASPSVALPAAAGYWSRHATELQYTADGERKRNLEVLAPDGRTRIVVTGPLMKVEVNGREVPGGEGLGANTLAELAWAPDSRAFFLTESGGGLVGEWFVTVYTLDKGKVVDRDVTREVIRRFKKHYRCIEDQPPNLGGVAWVQGSRRLLVVAEVPPHSNCPQMGKIRGYIVDVASGEVLQEFTAKELKVGWRRHIGDRVLAGE